MKLWEKCNKTAERVRIGGEARGKCRERSGKVVSWYKVPAHAVACMLLYTMETR